MVQIPTTRAQKKRFCTIPGLGLRSFSGMSSGQPYKDSIFASQSRRIQYCSFVIFLIVLRLEELPLFRLGLARTRYAFPGAFCSVYY